MKPTTNQPAKRQDYEPGSIYKFDCFSFVLAMILPWLLLGIGFLLFQYFMLPEFSACCLVGSENAVVSPLPH